MRQGGRSSGGRGPDVRRRETQPVGLWLRDRVRQSGRCQGDASMIRQCRYINHVAMHIRWLEAGRLCGAHKP